MKEVVIIGGVIGLLANFPLIWGIIKGNVKQSFVTYLLWGLLDIIALVSIILKDGNFWLPLGYTVGALLVATFLIFKGKVEWGKLETVVVAMVIVSLIVWIVFGNTAALISSVTALAIASVPQIIQTYKSPQTTPSGVYFLFALSGIISVIPGEWNLENKLYSLNIIIICSLIFVLSLRKNKNNI